MFKTIVLATDGSEGSKRAADLAIGLAKSEGGKLVLAHVTEHNIGKGGGDLVADEDDLVAGVEQMGKDLAAQGLDTSTAIRDESLGGPGHVIADIAKEAGADLIVTGTRGHSPIGGLLLGSVAMRLHHLSPCPVLTVPSQ